MVRTSKLIDSFKSEINQAVNENNISKLQDIITRFWEKIETINYPIIEELNGDSPNLSDYNLVTFLYRSDENLDNVFLLGEFNFVDPKDYIFDKIEHTDVFYKTFTLPKNTQAVYRILENDPLDGIFAGAKYANRWSKFGNHPDKLNKNIQIIRNGFEEGRDMIVTWLKDPQDDSTSVLLDDEPRIIGKLNEYNHSSLILKYSRKITVYTPPNYDSTLKYPYLIMLDGSLFLKYSRIHVIIDKFIENGQIPAIVAIFVDPGLKDGQTKRYDEYPCNSDFAKSITEEILPWVKEKYSISEDPTEAIIAGSSYGGLAAFHYSFMYPNKIKNVLSLSGSFHVGKDENSDYPYEWLPQKVAFSDKRDINVFMRVGKLEGEYHWDSPDFPNQIVSHRHFTTILKMKGYKFTYDEYNGDHSLVAWIKPFKEGLLYFLAKCNKK